jgi:hypothetical protein
MHYLFLQMVRGRVVCESFFPASICVVETQVPDNPALQWDFRDGVDSMFIAVRMGATGLLAVLQDSGVLAEASKEMLGHLPLPLHPLQFIELAARFGYGSTLCTRTPKYIVADGDPIRVIQLPLGGLSTKPLLAPWEPAAYARHLAFHTEIPLEVLYSPPDRVMSWLWGDGANPQSMALEEFPWPEEGRGAASAGE